ncbi:MAG: hypothetical protein Q8R67_25565 [Rhodoferax sp.]|nr:hypothetical protein [Rhodoferax sp.]MDP3655043.1 hypothetical protein [Rhodoferax sp.]
MRARLRTGRHESENDVIGQGARLLPGTHGEYLGATVRAEEATRLA